MSHFDEMTCLLFLEGQLEPPRARELSLHAESCAGCRALLHALQHESRLIETSLQEENEAVPARLASPPLRDRTPWAWIVSFGLAAATAYALWTGMIEPWQERLSEAGFGGDSLITLLLFRGAFWKGWGAMLQNLQIIAMVTLGIVAVALLRRSWRHWSKVAVVLAAALAVSALAPAARAAEFRKGETYTLPRGEVVKHDLIVTAAAVHIEGDVDGDLIVFGRGLSVDGHIGGDVIAFTEITRINGTVDGNVRVFTNQLLLTGTTNKNLSVFAANFNLDSAARVGGSAIIFSAEATLEGRIQRDLLGLVGHTLLSGSIGGDMRLRGERLTIGPTAEIGGAASYRGKRQPEVSPQAKLSSPLSVEIIRSRSKLLQPRYYLHEALRWGAAFLFGLLLATLLPGFFADAQRASKRYGLSLGVGALALVVGCVLAIIAILLLCIGVGMGAVLLLAYLPAMYASQVFIGTWVGEKLMGEAASTGALMERLALGLLLLRIVGLVPYLGGVMWLAVTVWGTGAILAAIYDRSRVLPAAPQPGIA